MKLLNKGIIRVYTFKIRIFLNYSIEQLINLYKTKKEQHSDLNFPHVIYSKEKKPFDTGELYVIITIILHQVMNSQKKETKE